MAEKVIVSGWLKKEGGFVHNWKKRWFELRGNRLYYYTESGGDLKGTVELTKDSIVQSTELIGQPAFTVQTTSKSRVYKIVSEKKQDRDHWVSEIRNLIQSLGSSLQKSKTSPLFSGVSSPKKEPKPTKNEPKPKKNEPEPEPVKKEPDLEVYVPKEENVVIRKQANQAKRRPPSRPKKG